MNSLKIFLIFFALSLLACDNGDNGTAVDNSDIVSVQAETFDDLPNCSKNREGDLAEVLDEHKAYRCQKGAWEFDHDVLDTVKTEDDLPACTGRKEGLSLFVQFEHAVYTCDGMRWTKVEKENADSGIVEYESEDDLPSCSDNREGSLALIDGEAYLCEDKHWNDKGAYYVTIDSLANCTAKREGEKAYIADEGTTLKCVDGEWISNAKNSSSSISKTSESAEGEKETGWREQCLDIINEYRATENLEPLALADEEKQKCADEQAAADLKSNKAHGHFKECGEWAQNSGPNASMANGRKAADVAKYYLDMMWGEKKLVESGERDLDKDEDYPYIGHYKNMRGDYTKVACGIAVSQDGTTGWFNVNFY